ncbi:MAG: redoxin, partial [Gammaproteobacteria bacterium]|nr:redoxin [Gammaproteobacteria bacterium]
MSLQRPKGALLRVCLWWRQCVKKAAPGAAASGFIAFGIGMAALAQPAYFLLGREAPDFALRAVAGSNVRLSEHRGDVVVVSFWSSRCTPCRTQLAALDRSLATYRSAGLQMYGINVDDDNSRALEFAHGGQAASFQLL